MVLALGIIQGSVQALSLVKSLLEMPRLISETPKFNIPLEADTFSKDSTAEVNESLIITTGDKSQKKYVTDNVAPSPWVWELSGYIPGSALLEMTTLYHPILKHNVEMLEQAYRDGSVLTFRDNNQKKWDVVIQHMHLDLKADCQNKQPFSMTLKEVVVAETDSVTADLSVSKIAEGSAIGDTENMGQTGAAVKESLLYQGEQLVKGAIGL